MIILNHFLEKEHKLKKHTFSNISWIVLACLAFSTPITSTASCTVTPSSASCATGSYSSTCTNAHCSGTTLTATCCTSCAGNPGCRVNTRTSSIDASKCANKSVENTNGMLTCG